MNIFLYVILFIMGTVFGSFYTLAVYRIPKNIDIIKKHSYCPNCNNKLGFFELIPILSYILLGGKCKHCKQKIRIRYLILEILSGCLFVMLGIILKIDILNIKMQQIIIYAFIILYLTALILILAIDKEYKKIDKKVLTYGVIISIAYMIYLYIVGETSLCRYAIYLAIYIIILLIDTFLLRKCAKDSYICNILMLLNVILIFTEIEILIMTVIMSILAILIYILITNITQKKTSNKKVKLSEIPIGFYIGTSNIIVLFMMTLINNCYIMH